MDWQLDIRRLATILGIPLTAFFDVGAHTGETSLSVLHNFAEALVFAFEPHPVTFSALSANVQNPRFEAFNIALSDRSGKAQLFEFGHLATCNSLVENNQFAIRTEYPSKVLEVDCQTVDCFCSEHRIDRIDVLKIDTEGHDLAVLQGAERTLACRGVKFVYVEFNSMLPMPGTAGGSLLAISAILQPLGFRFVASYPELMITTGDLFVTSNALFVRPPAH